MTLPTATPAERAALVRMVSASMRVVIIIGRAIKEGTAILDRTIDSASNEFVDAIKEVSETSKAADRESFQ